MSYSNLAASAIYHTAPFTKMVWTSFELSLDFTDKFPATCLLLSDAHLFNGTHG